MYVCQKVALAVLPMERGNRLGQGEGSLNGPIFPTPRAELAHVTPPTAYYRQSVGSAANFALGPTGLPRGHEQTNRVYPGQTGYKLFNVQQNPYTNSNKEKFGSFFSRALAYVVNGFTR